MSEPLGSSSAEGVPRPRRRRGLTEALLSIVLGLEAVLLFFVTLVVFGLKLLEPLPAFVGGGTFLVVLLIASGLQRHRWGVWLGAALQLALVATGFVFPLLFVLGAVFAGIWLWAFLRARAIERARAAYFAENPDAVPDPAPDQGEAP